jgi:hypothetical protein
MNIGVSRADGLGVRDKLRGGILRGVTIGGFVASLLAVEAAAFSDTLGMFSGGEFRNGDSVNIMASGSL